MNLDKRSVILITLSIFIFSAYNYYLQTKYPKHFVKPQNSVELEENLKQEEPLAVEEPDIAPISENPVSDQVWLSQEDLTFEDGNWLVRFNQKTMSLDSVRLKAYKSDLMSGQSAELLASPLYVRASTQPTSFSKEMTPWTGERSNNSITFSKQQNGFLITQEYIFPEDDSYEIELKLSFQNQSVSAQELTAGLMARNSIDLTKKSSGWGPASFVAQQKSIVYGLEGSRSEEIISSYCDEPDGPAFALRNEQLDYFGFDWHYFLLIFHPEGKFDFDAQMLAGSADSFCDIGMSVYQPYGIIQPGGKVDLSFKAYFGPKDVEILRTKDESLASVVKFGFFSVLAKPLLVGLKFFDSVFLNYGLAIIIVTIILKMLFYPLTKAAAVSMKKMQKLQPEMNRIREKYKEDPQRLQREMMGFMSKNKVNPAKGCLPILPQIPVFLAFYNVLSQAIELRHAPFFGWIQDLSAADPYYVTPILLGVGMFLQQKLTPNPSLDKNQAKIMMMLPIIFTAMMLSLPAGMVLYMLTNTVVSIIQQQWLNRRLEKQLA